MLYAGGGDMNIIQQRPGHSSFAATADMYAHLMQDSQAKATDKLSAPTGQPAQAGEYIF
jgi:integrase